MFIASSSEFSGDVPGLRSVATAIAHAMRAQGRNGGSCVSRNVIERPRQQHRHGSRRRHRRRPILIGIFQMIGGKRGETRRQRSAMQVGELVRMQFHPQPVRAGRFKNLLDFRRRKSNTLAKPIDGIGQILRRYLRDQSSQSNRT